MKPPTWQPFTQSFAPLLPRSGRLHAVHDDNGCEGTGVSVHTLRYYERAGLVVTTISRNDVGRRRYRQTDLDWIVICTKLRATGMPIKLIRRYAQLVAAGPGNEQERLNLLETHRAKVVAKLDQLQQHLKLIDYKIDVYQGRFAAGDADRLWATTARTA